MQDLWWNIFLTWKNIFIFKNGLAYLIPTALVWPTRHFVETVRTIELSVTTVRVRLTSSVVTLEVANLEAKTLNDVKWPVIISSTGLNCLQDSFRVKHKRKRKREREIVCVCERERESVPSLHCKSQTLKQKRKITLCIFDPLVFLQASYFYKRHC